MKIFFSPNHILHHPSYEDISQENWIPAYERLERAESVNEILKQKPWAQVLPPTEFVIDVIEEIHSKKYLNYLRSAYHHWKSFSPIPDMAFIPFSYGVDHQTAQAMSPITQDGFFLLTG